MSDFNYGGFERAQADASYRYNTDSARNAYGRFLAQQRGSRSLGDMSRNFGRSTPSFKANFGARGLAGPGVSSGVKRRGMQNWYDDYARGYGRQKEDTISELQGYDMNENQLYGAYQNEMANLEAQRAQAAADNAASIDRLRQQYGGI